MAESRLAMVTTLFSPRLVVGNSRSPVKDAMAQPRSVISQGSQMKNFEQTVLNESLHPPVSTNRLKRIRHRRCSDVHLRHPDVVGTSKT